MEKGKVVAGVAKITVWWLNERRRKLIDLAHETMAVNPFLAPLMLALGDVESFDDLAHLLLAGHFSTGHATGFGKLIDEKILPGVFGTTKLTSAYRRDHPWSEAMFDEIDHIVTRGDGQVCLLSQKASRWTIQLTMAVQLNRQFYELIEARKANRIKFDRIVVGVFYGTNDTLTDKYDILRGINRGANHNVFDLRSEVDVHAGRQFWSWLNDDEPDTQDWIMEGILVGIEQSKKVNGPIAPLMKNFKAAFSKEFLKHVGEDGRIDWMAILKMING